MGSYQSHGFRSRDQIPQNLDRQMPFSGQRQEWKKWSRTFLLAIGGKGLKEHLTGGYPCPDPYDCPDDCRDWCSADEALMHALQVLSVGTDQDVMINMDTVVGYWA